jgi:ASC-1-like (ASCH) protein
MKPRWAPDIQAASSKEIFIKRELLEMIKSGRKTLELRVAFPNFQSICIGDQITFKSSNDEIKVRVTCIRNHKGLGDVMESEDVSKLAPGVPQNQIRHFINRIFKEPDIEKYGLLVFEFEKIE